MKCFQSSKMFVLQKVKKKIKRGKVKNKIIKEIKN